MKKLTKFCKELYFYIEKRWLGINQWWLIGILVLILGISSTKTFQSRWFFLEASKKNKLAISCLMEDLIKHGYYVEAKDIVRQDNLAGWEAVLNPKLRLEKMIAEQKKILKESPYSKAALENLIRLNEALGRNKRAKYYQRLKEWADPID